MKNISSTVQFCAPQSYAAKFCAPQSILPITDQREKQPFVRRKLLFEVTEKCNLSCSNCYNQGNAQSRGAEFWIRSAEKAFQLGYRHLQIIGGEPTTLPWLYHMIQHLHAQGWKDVILFSNLSRFSPELITALSCMGYRVTTTFYSATEAAHDRATGVNGSFSNTVACLCRLLVKGIGVSISLLGATEEDRYKLEEMFGPDVNITGFSLVPATTPHLCSEVYNCDRCSGLEVINGSGMRGCIFGLPKKVDSPLLNYLKENFKGFREQSTALLN